MSLVSSKLTTLHVKLRMQHPPARASCARQARQLQIMPATLTSQQRAPSTVVRHMLRMQLQLVSRRGSKLPTMPPNMLKTLPTALVTKASKQLDQHSSMLRTLPIAPVRRASKQLGQHSSMLRTQLTVQARQASKQRGLLSRATTRLLILPARRPSRRQARHSKRTMMPQVLHQMLPQWASRRASKQQVVLPNMLTTRMTPPRTLQVGFFNVTFVLDKCSVQSGPSRVFMSCTLFLHQYKVSNCVRSVHSAQSFSKLNGCLCV